MLLPTATIVQRKTQSRHRLYPFPPLPFPIPVVSRLPPLPAGKHLLVFPSFLIDQPFTLTFTSISTPPHTTPPNASPRLVRVKNLNTSKWSSPFQLLFFRIENRNLLFLFFFTFLSFFSSFYFTVSISFLHFSFFLQFICLSFLFTFSFFLFTFLSWSLFPFLHFFFAFKDIQFFFNFFISFFLFSLFRTALPFLFFLFYFLLVFFLLFRLQFPVNFSIVTSAFLFLPSEKKPTLPFFFFILFYNFYEWIA